MRKPDDGDESEKGEAWKARRDFAIQTSAALVANMLAWVTCEMVSWLAS